MAEPRVLRIHYLVEADGGPIRSGGLKVNTPKGPLEAGKPGRYRFACDPSGQALPGEWDRATGEPWAVACQACVDAAEFQRDWQPHPHRAARPDAAEVVTLPPGCCG